jgi:hypothetical protein
MIRRLAPLALLLALGASAAAHRPAPATTTSPPHSLIAHEWGTFTSVAGRDGHAVEWLPLQAPPDLPRFVDHCRFNVKGVVPARIRMETPVLYFYASQTMRVSVNVRFHRGLVTEWFPRAVVGPATPDVTMLRQRSASSSIAWNDVQIVPTAPPEFPVESTSSHYYAARETDASPIESGGSRERFLFYRGVGGFDAPLTAAVGKDGSVVVTSPSGEPIGDVILFENDRGMIAYQREHVTGDRFTFAAGSGDGEVPAPAAELEQILVANGLYPMEARAMVKTWRDSWFESGRRLFYVVPRPTIDAILPLDITPAPSTIARVFVGRIELITSQTPVRYRPSVATR